MTTRAVLLTSSGAVHRVIAAPNGDVTACGERYQRAAPVTPKQALVYALDECHQAGCWGMGAWRHFVDGSAS